MEKNENPNYNEIKELIMQLIGNKKNQNEAIKLISKPVLDSQDVRIILNNSERTMVRLRKGTLPYTDINGRYYYFWDDILPILEKRRRGGK